MSLEKSINTLLLVEWKHVFPSPSKTFDKFDKLLIQGSSKWIKEWNKVQEECMKQIDIFFYAWSEFVLVKNDEIIISSKYTAHFR